MSNITRQYYKVGSYLKKNAPTILSGLGAAGVVCTAISTIKATPKALDILEYQEEKKGAELTTYEKVVATAPVYFPAIFLGTATIACILGANALNKRQQAMLTSAYAYLSSSYNEYREKVKAIFGEEGEQRVRDEIAKDKYNEQTIPECGELKLFFDQFSGRYFEMSLFDLQNAVYKLNREYALHGEISLNKFYEYIDLPVTEYGEVLGWCSAKDWEFYGYSWIDIKWSPLELADGLEAYVISFDIDPTENFEEWAW